MDKYTITPLKWKRYFSERVQSFTAQTVFGSYTVDRMRYGSDVWSNWRWECCFDEDCDEGGERYKSSVEGKREAENHW